MSIAFTAACLALGLIEDDDDDDMETSYERSCLIDDTLTTS